MMLTSPFPKEEKKMYMNKSMTSRNVPARKHLRLALFCLVALSALVFLAACGDSSTGTPAATATQAGNTQTVMIITGSSGLAFSPASLTIKAGTTVVWKNTTSVSHTVTSDDGKSFDSGSANPIAPGATFSFTFNTAGTFAYHCAIHPFMMATIIVQ
jgi:plastocyanin